MLAGPGAPTVTTLADLGVARVSLGSSLAEAAYGLGVRKFKSFREAASEAALSRIYGGIHFQFESDASRSACAKVPEFTNKNFMVPRRR